MIPKSIGCFLRVAWDGMVAFGRGFTVLRVHPRDLQQLNGSVLPPLPERAECDALNALLFRHG